MLRTRPPSRALAAAAAVFAAAPACDRRTQGDPDKGSASAPARSDASDQRPHPRPGGRSREPSGSAAGKRAPLPADPGGGHRIAWGKALAGPGRDNGMAVAVDAAGHSAFVGVFSGEVDLGSGTAARAEGVDAYVIVYDRRDVFRWSRRIGGKGDDVASSVAFDRAGNILVAGWFSDTIVIGESVLTSAGGDDLFVAKFSPDGAPLWALRFGDSHIDLAWGVAVDQKSHVLVAGEFRRTVDFAANRLASAGNADAFVVRLTPAGRVVWARRFGDKGEDYARAVAVDSRGDVLVAGEFSGRIDLGDAPLESTGNRDMIVAKLTSAGAAMWSRGLGNPLNDTCVGLAVDPADNVFISGAFEDTLHLEGQTVTTAGQTDALIAKFDPQGRPLWWRKFGGPGPDLAYGLAADRYGNVVAAGWFTGRADFGGGPWVAPQGNKDAFLLKLSPAGNYLWSRPLGNRDHDLAKGVALGNDDDLFATGTFRFDLDLGTTLLRSAAPRQAKIAPGDAFLLRFSR